MKLQRASTIFQPKILRQGHAKQREPVPVKSKTVIAGAGGTAKVPSPSDRGLLNADEELSQVRASKELKEGREVSVVPRIKPIAVGQQKPK